MKSRSVMVATAVVVAIGIGLVLVFSGGEPAADRALSKETGQASSVSITQSSESSDPDSDGSASLTATDAVLPEPESELFDAEQTPISLSAESQSAAYEMARGDWSDADFYAAVEQLKRSPELMQALLVEFQGETDNLRLRRISQLLADTNSPLLADAATSMLYSGNDASKAAGMDLLRRIQPGNPAARDVAIDLLATETDPLQLKSALDIFAKPGVATADQHSAIINQVAPLASHESPLLRRQSLSILSSWVDDDSQTPVFRAGLVDQNAKVRQSAAFAVVDYPFADDALKLDLLTMAESDQDDEVRRAALLALASLPLSDEQRQRAEDARKR